MSEHELRPGGRALAIGTTAAAGDAVYALESPQLHHRKRLAVALTELRAVLSGRGLVLLETGPGWFRIERKAVTVATCAHCTPYADLPGLIWFGSCRRCASRAPHAEAA